MGSDITVLLNGYKRKENIFVFLMMILFLAKDGWKIV